MLKQGPTLLIFPFFLNLTSPDCGTLHFPGPAFPVLCTLHLCSSLCIPLCLYLLVYFLKAATVSQIPMGHLCFFPSVRASQLIMLTLAASQGSQKCYSPLGSSKSPWQPLFLLRSPYFLSPVSIWYLVMYCTAATLTLCRNTTSPTNHNLKNRNTEVPEWLIG